MTRISRLGVLFSLLVVFVLVGGVAFAAGVIPGTDGIIHGCYDNRSGALRAIDPAISKCKSNETAIEWNQQGPQGDTGAAGAQGETGPQGPAGVPYARTVVVSPVGTAAENGQALLAALAGITASAADPYLLKLEPGLYDLGTSPLTMEQYVDIEGSGELRTRVTRAGSGTSYTGTVVGANNAELRLMTVENRGGNTWAKAIYNASASPRLTQVTATASGGAQTYGVHNTSSSPAMTNVTATASGTGSGGGGNYGVANTASSSPAMTNVTATASEGTNSNYGVFNSAASPTIDGGVIKGSGAGSGYGIYNTSTYGSVTVKVNNSRILGTTETVRNDAGSTLRVGASQLEGGGVSSLGTVTCAASYNGAYAPLNSTCTQ